MTKSCGAPISPTPPASSPIHKSIWQKTFAGVPENEKRAMTVDNCVRYFQLERLESKRLELLKQLKLFQ